MENAKAKHIWHEFINRFELYIGCVLFLAMMVLLTIQVVTRYFGHAITWTEELSCIMLVWMSYLGFAGAITSRKHLRIDAFINSRPFKVKKVMLIISNIINGIFAALLISPMYKRRHDIPFNQRCFSYHAHSESGLVLDSAVLDGADYHPHRAGMHPPGKGRRKAPRRRQADVRCRRAGA